MSSGNGDEHVPSVLPVIVEGVPRLDAQWLERYASLDVCDVADEVGPLYTMDPGLRPLATPPARAVGQALTVKAWPADNLTIHGALGMVQDGDMLIVDWRGYTGACGSGSRALLGPAGRGLRGVVIDGAWRDAATLPIPVYGRATSATSPSKQHVGEINTAVSCGGVVVHPGDLVIADEAGVVTVPLAHIDEVWQAVSRRSAASAPAGAPSRRRQQYFAQQLAARNGRHVAWPAARTLPPATTDNVGDPAE